MGLEINVDMVARAARHDGEIRSEDVNEAAWYSAVMLVVGLAAGVVAFLPFVYDTSAWDAVTFRVPGNQGNWWHFLAGAPFFLAYPMIWLRLRAVFATGPLTDRARRVVWGVIGASIAGTMLVESPFMLHLAGTRGWPRFSMLSVGFGMMVGSGVLLFLRRRCISATRACLAGLDTAYLANAALCLVVYAGAPGSAWSRSGWYVMVVIVWPMLIEILWIGFGGGGF
jgi:hypothetical protein